MELAGQFQSANNRPLAELSRAELDRLDDKAKNTLMLLRSHLTFCVRQAVPGHPQAMTNDGIVDLRDVREEIDSAIAEITKTRVQIGEGKRNPSAASLVVAANPETVHQTMSAEERILQLEKQRRMGDLSDSEFASALRAVLLSNRA